MGLLTKVRRAVRHVRKKGRQSQASDKENSKTTEKNAASKANSSMAFDKPRPSTDPSSPQAAASSDDNEATTSVRNGVVKSAKGGATAESIGTFFARYKDSEEDAILADGMERFCADMQVEPTDVRMLALAWKFGAVTMCRFNREQFADGCRALGVDSATALRDKLDSIVDEASRSYRDFYKFTFDFGLDPGERCLARDMAIALWRLVLPVNGEDADRFTDDWCTFLETGGVRGVTRDCWMVYLEFCQVVDKDFANYSDEDAWPSLLDEFVEQQLQKKNAREGQERACSEADE